MAKLPSVTSSIPRDLQQFILRVKETLEGNGPDAMVSARQLIAAGIAEGIGNGGITAPVSDVVDPPRAPTGVSAAGALATIIVSWNSPAYRGHAYSEIWAASRTQAQTDATPPENPIIGQAELVGMTAGNNFSHNLGSGAQRWYWVRFVNRNGVAGPYNLTNGTFGQTSQDPAYMLEVLTDAVTSSQLATTLLANINTTFSQASEPTQKADGTALVAGDLWYDTDDGNKLYRYDGTQWVNAQDGGIAQAIADAGGAQGTADGKITTYYQDASPTNQQGTLNEGDLWVDTNDGNNLYRWNNTTSSWVDIQDDGIGTAIQDASDAQSTADKKTITFFQDDEPTTTDDAELGEGDLWIDTNDNNKLYRHQYVTVNGQQVLQWVTVRDAGIATALGDASNAQSTADGKILTFYQDDAPTTTDNADLGVGDIWFDTNDGRKMYRYQVTGQDSNNSDIVAWAAIPDAAIATAISDASAAQSTADGKITSYYQDDEPPNTNGELSEGDLWTDTNDNDSTYRWDDDGGQNGTGEWVRIGLASFTDVNTAITDQVGYCELSIVSGGNTAKSVSTANTTQTACQAAQADVNKPSNYTYAWKSDGAIASEVKTVTSSVDTNTATIQVQSQSIDGLEAQYTVKIDNNGHLAGFGLASELVDGTISSDFMVAADRFSVVDPSAVSWYDLIKITDYGNSKRAVFGPLAFVQSFPPNSEVKIMGHPDGHNGNFSVHGTGSLGGVYFIVAAYSASQPLGTVTTSEASAADLRATRTGAPPFIIATGTTQINGETVPAGTYINSAMIADATIKQAQIGTLNADVINSGLLNTVDFYGNTIAGASIYLGGTITYTTDSSNNNIGIASIATPKVAMTSTGAVFAVDAFTVNNPGGTDVVPFSITSDVVSIDSALIKDGTITNAQIGNQIASTAYLADNTTGWAISKNGDAILNDATFRGTLDITGSSGSNRLEITGDTIKVIDSSNVVRVKIGDLS